MLGPLAYDLGFTDSALCCVFGTLLGSAGSGYMSTFGPESGNRTMVSRAFFCSLLSENSSKSGGADMPHSGCCEILHGLLPKQNLLLAQHGDYAWLWND